jgi:glycyl-tRNA synthetase beta chain
MVMADDPTIQRNRLALLASLQALFLEIADISELQ